MPEADPNQTRAETIEQPAVFRVSVAFRSQAAGATCKCLSSSFAARWAWQHSCYALALECLPGCSAVASAIPRLGNGSDTSDPGRFYRERNARRWHSQLPRRHLPLQARRNGIGGVGVSRLNATGRVSNLRSLADFEGVYGQLRSGWAAGDQGRGTLWMQNANGVYLRWSVYAAGYH